MKPLSQYAFSVSQEISSVVSVEGVHIPFQWESPPDVFHLSPPPTSALLLRHASLSHILGKKLTPTPSPAKAFTLRTGPETPLLQEGRDSNMKQRGQFSGALHRKLPSVCLILFLLNSSTSCIVLRICHSPPWWSFPGLTILLYLLSPYNTAVPWLPYLGCPVSAKPFQEGLQRAPW